MIPSCAIRRLEGKEHAQNGSGTHRKTLALQREAKYQADCPRDGGEPPNGEEIPWAGGALPGRAREASAACDGGGGAADRGGSEGMGTSACGQAPTDLGSVAPGTDYTGGSDRGTDTSALTDQFTRTPESNQV